MNNSMNNPINNSKNTRLLRLRVPTAIIAVGALGMLAGCSGASGGDAATSTPASSISLVVPSAAQNDTPYQRIAKDYEKATGYAITVKILPPDSYDQTVRTELQAGTATDLIGVTPGQALPTSTVTLAQAGLLEPITLPSVTASVSGDLTALFTVKGSTYALPTGVGVFGLVTNETALQAKGQKIPTTWSELIATCKATGQDPGFTTMAGAQPGGASLLALQLSATAVYAQNPHWNADRAAGKTTFAKTRGWHDVLQAVVDMNAAGCFPKGIAGQGFDAVLGGLVKGSALTTPLPSSVAAELSHAAAGTTFTVNALPPTSAGSPYLLAGPSFGIAVSKAASPAAKAAADKFLDWLAKPANQATLAGYEGSIPRDAVADKSKISPVFSGVADLLVAGEYTYLPSNDWSSPAVSQALGTGVQSLLTGSGDIDAILAAMDAAWK